jgi:hypothetical protein
MWSALQNSEDRCLVTLRYSPCNNTPSAATALTIAGVSLLICKKKNGFLTPTCGKGRFIFYCETLMKGTTRKTWEKCSANMSVRQEGTH